MHRAYKAHIISTIVDSEHFTLEEMPIRLI